MILKIYDEVFVRVSILIHVSIKTWNSPTRFSLS